MSRFPVTETKRLTLEARLASLGLHEEDLDEQFIRSRGAGGQHVNKTSTTVVLLHRPTGLTVRYGRERSQGLNRFMARRILADKLDRLLNEKRSAEIQAREKIRRQKRRRSRRAKTRMLADKRHQSLKKETRRAPSAEGS